MLKGIDISKWQGVGTGDQATDFVICKATEGAGYVDPLCDQHYQRAKSQNKLLGVYHFARPDLNDPITEARFFVQNIQGYLGEAILALDWEQPGTQHNVGWAKEWLDEVQRLTSIKPLVYMSASVIGMADWSAVAKDYGLWIAGYPSKYNVPDPATPNPCDMPYSIGPWEFWAIWQYTSSTGTLDRDIANMTKTAWKKYAKPNSEPTPTPTPTPAPTPTPMPAPSTGFNVGDKVTLKTWVDYNGNSLMKTRDYYTISEINGNRAVLKSDGVVYAAVNTANLVKYNGDSSSGGVINYAVRKGDTLSAIAERYGTSWQKIAADNGLDDPDFILPGQRLVIRK